MSPRERSLTVDVLDPGRPAHVDRAIVTGTALQAARGDVVDDLGAQLRVFEPDGPLEGWRAALLVARNASGDVGRCLTLAPALRALDAPPPDGVVALWECADDAEIQRALVETACGWLGAQGCDGAVGPVDLTLGGRAGFASGGRPEQQPMLSPSTAPGARTWEQAGARVVAASATWTQRLQRGIRASAPAGMHLRTLAPAHLDAALADMCELADRAATGDAAARWPRPGDAMRATLLRAGRFLDPNLVVFAIAADGTLAGFALALPDYSRGVRALDGDWDAPLRAGRRTEHAALLHTLVTDPRHHDPALATALVDGVAANARLAGARVVHHLCVADGSPHHAALTRTEATATTRWSCLRRPLETVDEPLARSALVRDIALEVERRLSP